MTPTPPEVRLDPATGRLAIKTQLPAARAWFIFDPQGGGHYAPGTRAPDAVEQWLPYTPPEISEEP